MRLLLFLFIVISFPVKAAEPFSRDFQLNDNGTGVKVNGIVRDDSKGFWLATEGGVLYFNGRGVSPPVDSSRNVNVLIRDNGNVIYGCQDGSVYRLQGSRRMLLLKANAPVKCLLGSSHGLIIGTEGDGIYLYSSHNLSLHFSTNDFLPDDYVYAITAFNGKYLFGTDLDFFRGWPQKDNKPHFEEIYHFGDITRVVRNADGASGVAWLGFQERGLAVTSGVFDSTGRVEALTNKDSWHWGQVNDILVVNRHQAWVVTEDGWLLSAKVSSNTGDTKIFVTEHLFIGRPILSLNADDVGNIWLGTELGLTQVTAGYLHQIALNPGYDLKRLSVISADRYNNIWFSQENELWVTNIMSKASSLVHRWNRPLSCLYAEPGGDIWVGTTGQGLWLRGVNGQLQHIANTAEMAEWYVLSVTRLADRLWVSTLSGVEELQITKGSNPRWVSHHGKNNGLGSDIIYQMFTDSKDRIWFGSDGAGISMLEKGQWTRWQEKDGFKTGVIYSITEDARGNIWAATLNDGIFCFNNQNWTSLGRSDGLSDQTITSIAADNSGHVFATSPKGIDIWYPRDKAFRHVNRRTSAKIANFPSSPNIIGRSSDGDILVPSDSGLIVLKNRPALERIRPALKLTDVQLFFKKLDRFPERFQYDEDHISIYFQGINFVHSETLFYRYRLEGFNKDWISTSDNFVTYPRLPPGQYKFTIQASLNESFAQPVESSYSFTIAAPFWKTWWFAGSLLIAMLTGLYFLFRWRINITRQMARIEQERMSFEYEHLKSQVNPHFLFNSLNTLAALIEEQPSAAVSYAEQLSDLYREALDGHKENAIFIEEEFKALDRYYYIQHARFGNALVLHDRLSVELKKAGKVVPLALQLLVENAIKHNVVSRSAPLVIHIEADGEWLVVRNQINPKKHKEKSTGLGLKNIRQRYKLVTAKEIKTTVNNNEFTVKLPLL